MTNENTIPRTPRLDFAKAAPTAFKALVALGFTPARRRAPRDTGVAQHAAA